MIQLQTDFIKIFNKMTKAQQAFVFLIDFEGQKPLIFPAEEASSNGLYYQTPSATNFSNEIDADKDITVDIQPIDKKIYKNAFDLVQKHLHRGDTYLLNLTMQTPIKISASLKDIFTVAKAPYKIYLKDKFVCFSPETFIKTQGNSIKTFPMKGTIDADLPNAKKRLLSNQKETNEHHTIVDLLRNDLSMISSRVRVNRFKFLDKINTNQVNLLQMSSEIEGLLPEKWQEQAGEMFQKLLPAGSISGAPKKKTLEIIKDAEQVPRGYYTGIFGYFDGKDFDTAVMIRYIEKTSKGYVYRSGGGITAMSHLEDEYNEIIDKIYVPIN